MRSKADCFMTPETTLGKKNSAASFPKDGKGSMGIDFLNYKIPKKIYFLEC
jgi:hypothetical protein